MKNSTDIARNNSFSVPPRRKRSSIYDLDYLDRQLDEIITYVGLNRPVPAPASGDFADMYYDKLERDMKLKAQGKEPLISVLAPSTKSKHVRKLSNTQLRINLQEKIQDIYDYLGVRKHEFRPTDTGGIEFRYAYRHKKAMDRWVFEPR